MERERFEQVEGNEAEASEMSQRSSDWRDKIIDAATDHPYIRQALAGGVILSPIGWKGAAIGASIGVALERLNQYNINRKQKNERAV